MNKREVREFYNQIGWQEIEAGVYQNARYEDLRPVSQAYIHSCHMRVPRHLGRGGRFLLDAGSGPIQYEEYLAFSEGYTYRVCADISDTALKEARKKIGDHGMFVVADIANLPFKADAFDGLVTLHTIHHLPLDEHASAYSGLDRVLKPGETGVIVNGWSSAPLMDGFRSFSRFRRRVWIAARRLLGRPVPANMLPKEKASQDSSGTFVEKHNPAWFKRTIAPKFNVEILVWRSASVHFLKNYISEKRGGRQILRALFALEERFPRFFGEKGTYPLIVLRKEAGPQMCMLDPDSLREL